MKTTLKLTSALSMMLLLAMSMAPTASAAQIDPLDDTSEVIILDCEPFVDCVLDAIFDFCNKKVCPLVWSVYGLVWDVAGDVIVLVFDLADATITLVENVCDDVWSGCPLVPIVTIDEVYFEGA